MHSISTNLLRAPTRPTRMLLCATALITVVMLLWIYTLSHSGGTHGLSPIFFYLFTVGDYAGLECMLVILLAAALISRRFPTLPVLAWVGDYPEGIAAASAVMLSCGAWWVYRHTPLSMDEYSAFFQSEVFAAGRLAGQFPPAFIDWLIPRGFQNYFLGVAHDTGRVTSMYWPSFALLMTPFTWLGVPWICNPVLSAATVLSVHHLARRIFGDRDSAGLAVLLTVASPVFFADGISYYSMSAHLLANTLYALLLIAPTPRKAFGAGLIGSVALTLHNPVPHLLFALPWIVSVFRSPAEWRTALALAAGYLPLCLLVGLGWFLLTTPSGHEVARMTTPFAWPTSAGLLARLAGIVKLWAWAVPGLLILAVIGGWKWRHDRTCLLLASSALLTLLGYVFVPFDLGHGWGYRYFHSAWIALPILAAAAAARPPRSTVNVGGNAGEFRQGGMFEGCPTLTFIVASALLSLVVSMGLRAVQIHNFVVWHQSQVPAYAGTEHHVVILDTRATFYGRDLIQNDPWLRENTIMMITHGAQADVGMMRANFPQMHEVYADRFGSVWSAAGLEPSK